MSHTRKKIFLHQAIKFYSGVGSTLITMQQESEKKILEA